MPIGKERSAALIDRAFTVDEIELALVQRVGARGVHHVGRDMEQVLGVPDHRSMNYCAA